MRFREKLGISYYLRSLVIFLFFAMQALYASRWIFSRNLIMEFAMYCFIWILVIRLAATNIGPQLELEGIRESDTFGSFIVPWKKVEKLYKIEKNWFKPAIYVLKYYDSEAVVFRDIQVSPVEEELFLFMLRQFIPQLVDEYLASAVAIHDDSLAVHPDSI